MEKQLFVAGISRQTDTQTGKKTQRGRYFISFQFDSIQNWIHSMQIKHGRRTRWPANEFFLSITTIIKTHFGGEAWILISLAVVEFLIFFCNSLAILKKRSRNSGDGCGRWRRRRRRKKKKKRRKRRQRRRRQRQQRRRWPRPRAARAGRSKSEGWTHRRRRHHHHRRCLRHCCCVHAGALSSVWPGGPTARTAWCKWGSRRVWRRSASVYAALAHPTERNAIRNLQSKPSVFGLVGSNNMFNTSIDLTSVKQLFYNTTIHRIISAELEFLEPSDRWKRMIESIQSSWMFTCPGASEGFLSGVTAQMGFQMRRLGVNLLAVGVTARKYFLFVFDHFLCLAWLGCWCHNTTTFGRILQQARLDQQRSAGSHFAARCRSLDTLHRHRRWWIVAFGFVQRIGIIQWVHQRRWNKVARVRHVFRRRRRRRAHVTNFTFT